MSQSVAAPAPGNAGGAGGAGSTGSTGSTGRASRKRGLLVVVLVLFALALAVAATRAWYAYHAFRRLDAARASPGVRDPADYPIQSWLPVRVVARNHRVPVSVLLDALRAAGFTDGEVRAIGWDNWRRVLERAWSGG